MISEPEVAGEFSGAEPREVIGDFDQEPAGRRGPRSPWVWGLGGVVVASALWAVALPLLGVFDRKPDMRGYELDRDLCRSLQLRSIGGAIAPREPTPHGRLRAVEASCTRPDPVPHFSWITDERGKRVEMGGPSTTASDSK